MSRARIRLSIPSLPQAVMLPMLSTQAESAVRMSEAASSSYPSPVRRCESFQSVRQQNLARMSPMPAPVMMRGAAQRISKSMRISDTVWAFSARRCK